MFGKILHAIALTLVIVGAINWGLIGAFAFNLVAMLFGDMTAISRLIYLLVGLAGCYLIFATLVRPKPAVVSTAKYS